MMFILNSGSLIAFVVYVTPLIEIFNVLLGVGGVTSFGQITRIIILGVMLCVLMKEQPRKALLLISLTAFLTLRDALCSVAYHVRLMGAVTYDIRYVYVLTFFALLMCACRTGRVTERALRALSLRFTLEVALIVIFSRLTGLGVEYARSSTTRLFTEVNALSALLVWGLTLWIYEAFYGHDKRKSFIPCLIVLYAACSQGTKSGAIGAAVCIALIVFYALFVRGHFLKGMFFLGVACVALLVMYRYYFAGGSGTEHMLRWLYWFKWSGKGAGTLWFLLSGRNEKVLNEFTFFANTPPFLLFGASFTLADYQIHLFAPQSNYAATEMDIFDLFLLYGVFLGGAVALYLTRRAFQCAVRLFSRRRDAYDAASYIIFYILMFMGGHVLNSPFAGIAFCLSLALTDRNIRRKRAKNSISALSFRS